MDFLSSLVSKRLGVTVAAGAFVQSLPMTADWKGVCITGLALVYVIAQSYVESKKPQPAAPAKAEEKPAEPAAS